MNRVVAVAATLAISVAGLAACSGSSTSTEESAAPAASAAAASVAASAEASMAASPEESMVGGMATCDEASLGEAITGVLDAEGNGLKLISLDGLECADGWASTSPTLGTTDEDAVTYTWVFEAEGQFWVYQDRMAVCGTQDVNDLEAYPSDAQVPEAIYQDACNTN